MGSVALRVEFSYFFGFFFKNMFLWHLKLLATSAWLRVLLAL